MHLFSTEFKFLTEDACILANSGSEQMHRSPAAPSSGTRLQLRFQERGNSFAKATVTSMVEREASYLACFIWFVGTILYHRITIANPDDGALRYFGKFSGCSL